MHRPVTRYLLRLDDYCPTSRRECWNPLLTRLQEVGIRPIVAVIPSNDDPELKRASADPEFWPRLCALEAAGVTVGLHGYRHSSRSHGRSLVALHRDSEFAGAGYETQLAWIRAGLEILRGEGLHPRLWIAPRHGLDRNTLRVLRQVGLEVLSDGFARTPFRRGSIVWLPQQLWAPVECGPGLWTICLHPDTATDDELETLCAFLHAHRERFISFDRAMAAFPAHTYGLADAFYGRAKLLRIQLSRLRKKLRR